MDINKNNDDEEPLMLMIDNQGGKSLDESGGSYFSKRHLTKD